MMEFVVSWAVGRPLLPAWLLQPTTVYYCSVDEGMEHHYLPEVVNKFEALKQNVYNIII